MGWLREFLIDESVFAGKRLYVLCQLGNFLGFKLCELGLLVNLLSKRLALWFEVLYFWLSFEKLPV